MAARTSLLALVALITAALAGAAAPATAQASLQVTFKTTAHGGNYAPRNVVAVWIEDPAGTFVKTVGRWANTRRSHLVAWTAKAGAADVDAVSGATRPDHVPTLNLTWDLKNRAGAEVPDGTYTIRMELADRNSSTAAENDQGTFTFVKNGTSATQTNLTSGGFNTVGITYTAMVSATCGDGTLDAGETCDPIATCPTSCPAPADACQTNTLVGSAAACTAACALATISACGPDDGCCPVGCTDATDGDCPPAGGGGANTVTGGCSTGGGPVPLVVGLGFALALAVRRRR
ncbi:MAG: DUF2271 domain-containing protein [Myxococcales bacterium]|nr:DUF2271 domain-containing protein [Myxococcales bacterium]